METSLLVFLRSPNNFTQLLFYIFFSIAFRRVTICIAIESIVLTWNTKLIAKKGLTIPPLSKDTFLLSLPNMKCIFFFFKREVQSLPAIGSVYYTISLIPGAPISRKQKQKQNRPNIKHRMRQGCMCVGQSSRRTVLPAIIRKEG